MLVLPPLTLQSLPMYVIVLVVLLWLIFVVRRDEHISTVIMGLGWLSFALLWNGWATIIISVVISLVIYPFIDKNVQLKYVFVGATGFLSGGLIGCIPAALVLGILRATNLIP